MSGKKTPSSFCDAILDIKTIILPRQARDKHRKNSKRERRFLIAWSPRWTARPTVCRRLSPRLQVPAPANISVKTAETSATVQYQGQLENRKNGFETRRRSNYRPFSLGSSRFNVQTSAQNGATTLFGYQVVILILAGAGMPIAVQLAFCTVSRGGYACDWSQDSQVW